MIRQCLTVFNVDDFSEMKGKYIWVIGEGEGFSFKPTGFQSMAVDGKVKTFMFDEVYQEFKESN